MFQVVYPQPDDDEMARIAAEMRRLLAPLPAGDLSDWTVLLRKLEDAVVTSATPDSERRCEPLKRNVRAAE
ncbi:hypothetical protein GCM10007036_06060 [Alsobacter metallidurans]|uniref:Uncharacterized protein n=1 Tax=Alsobacter metallidurans TaxID=340221 RepID=A0A917MGE6_9HYPH|nr:hypothetical protein [Alsobacter metallidurans]GGH09829.1 hypothetical protein GCM10007036_06060 [Alsobacter metallidurans]